MMTEIVPNGAMGRVTEDHESIDGWVYKGTLFKVDEFFPAGDDTGEYLPATYHGYTTNDSHVEPLMEYVELYKTAEETAARRIPTREEVAKAVSSAVMGIWGDGFSVHTGEKPDPEELEFAATTDDGLEFAFTLKVVDVEVASW